MLNEHTLQQLRALRLDGMAAAVSDPASQIAASELPFEQRLALLVQREVDWRDGKRLERLLKAARLKVSSACLEDIDWRSNRGLSREVIGALANGGQGRLKPSAIRPLHGHRGQLRYDYHRHSRHQRRVSAITWNAVRDERGITVRHQWNTHPDQSEQSMGA